MGRARATRALLALVAVFACLGAVAYAATRPAPPGLAGSRPVAVAPQQGAEPSPGGSAGSKDEQLPRTRLIEYPEKTSSAAEPQFRFHVPSRPQPLPAPPSGAPAEPERPRRFQCRLDGDGWMACGSPYRLRGLAVGDHSFAVRAFSRAGQPGAATAYSWRRSDPPAEPVEVAEQAAVSGNPKPFSIELAGAIEELFPGFPAQPLPVVISNSNTSAIEITALSAAIAGDSPECPADNFTLTPSSVSPATPVAVPAGGSVSLPTATVTAPTIAMLNLPVNQDACRGAEVPLVFDGEAHG